MSNPKVIKFGSISGTFLGISNFNHLALAFKKLIHKKFINFKAFHVFLFCKPLELFACSFFKKFYMKTFLDQKGKFHKHTIQPSNFSFMVSTEYDCVLKKDFELSFYFFLGRLSFISSLFSSLHS